jgi:hypothetical protein
LSKQIPTQDLIPEKRFVLPKTYSKMVGYGLTSITKSINKGWLEISEFPTIEGEFIDILKYPPADYFKLIINKANSKRDKFINRHFVKS